MSIPMFMQNELDQVLALHAEANARPVAVSCACGAHSSSLVEVAGSRGVGKE